MVEGVVEVELIVLDAGAEVCPGVLVVGVFVEAAEVGGDAGVEARDDVVEELLLVAHLGQVRGAFEAVLLVDQLQM